MATILHTLTRIAALRSFRFPSLSLGALLVIGYVAMQAVQLREELEPPSFNSAATVDKGIKQPSTELGRGLLSLFGPGAGTQAIAADTVAELPESNLDVKVSAIFFMDPPEDSTAVLLDGDRTLLLKPGEEVRPGIAVQRVESHRITLKRNGKLEQISFSGFGDGPDQAPPESQLPVVQAPEPIADALATSQPVALDPTATTPNVPPAYQQYIQRKLAQNQ